MVELFLELTAPPARIWVIGQSPKQAAFDLVNLLLRALLLTTCNYCW